MSVNKTIFCFFHEKTADEYQSAVSLYLKNPPSVLN